MYRRLDASLNKGGVNDAAGNRWPPVQNDVWGDFPKSPTHYKYHCAGAYMG
jgi:hypothetical protein